MHPEGPRIADEGGARRTASPVNARPRPIATYLFVLALVALVPAFVFSAVLLARNNDAQEAIVSSLTSATTQAIASAIDRQIEGLTTTLRVLATADSLHSDGLGAFHERARRALTGREAYLLVLDENLDQLINTRVPLGAPLGPTADPESARAALESGRVGISGVFYGPTAEAWVYNVVMPLAGAVGPARVMILTQNASNLSEALASRALPDGWNAALVDAKGLVIASSRANQLKAGEPFPLAYDPGMASRGRWQSGTDAGEDIVAVQWNVRDSGWHVIAWAPRGVVERPLANAFWSLLVGGILLAAVVVLIIYWVSMQIGRSVKRLEADARLLGAGGTVPERDYPISEIATVSDSIVDASRQRRQAETEVRLLMRELAHRSKNQMTVIAAMAKQSAKGAESVSDYVAGFEKRIYSLARSTDLLLAHGIAGVELRDVLSRQIDPLCPLDSGRVTLTGPPLRLNTQSAQILGMAAHEMATNAVKYGAFATDRGLLDVVWSLDAESLRLVWRERQVALIERPEHRGFGTTVIETMVVRSLGAVVNRTLHPDGIEWEFLIPAEGLDVHTAPRDEPGTAPAAAQPAVATGSGEK